MTTMRSWELIASWVHGTWTLTLKSSFLTRRGAWLCSHFRGSRFDVSLCCPFSYVCVLCVARFCNSNLSDPLKIFLLKSDLWIAWYISLFYYTYAIVSNRVWVGSNRDISVMQLSWSCDCIAECLWVTQLMNLEQFRTEKSGTKDTALIAQDVPHVIHR